MAMTTWRWRQDIVDNVNDRINDHAMAETKANALAESHHRGDEPHLLREVLRAQQVMTHSFSREMGRPASHFALMSVLAHAERGLGVREIAAALDVDAAAVTRIVNAMEVERLIRRRADSHDGRRHYVSLTDKGLTLFADIHQRTHDLERRLAAELGADAMRAAAATLARLRAIIEQKENQ
jgi:DNA-binding MarR family transcriptional regulator